MKQFDCALLPTKSTKIWLWGGHRDDGPLPFGCAFFCPSPQSRDKLKGTKIGLVVAGSHPALQIEDVAFTMWVR